METQEISFVSLIATIFHSSFVRKIYLTAKIFNIYIISIRLTYVNVCRSVFRTQQNIYGGAPLKKSQKNCIADVSLGSKYVCDISFTVEKVYRRPIFVQRRQSQLCQKYFSSINEKHVGFIKCSLFSGFLLLLQTFE